MDKFDYFKSIHYPNCINTVNQFKEVINNKTIIDVGSNIGLFSMAVAELVNYNSIHLFEPSKELFEKSKILLKDYPNIYYNNFGLSDQECDQFLYKSTNENIGWNTMLTKDPNQGVDFFKNLQPEIVKNVTLDSYYKNIEDIGFIKIDVEGFERHVILGALALIEKFKPFILVEVGWGKNHPEWDQNYSVYQKIFDLGYKPIEFSPTETQDVLFVPR